MQRTPYDMYKVNREGFTWEYIMKQKEDFCLQHLVNNLTQGYRHVKCISIGAKTNATSVEISEVFYKRIIETLANLN